MAQHIPGHSGSEPGGRSAGGPGWADYCGEYKDCLTTGGRPPAECRAPVRTKAVLYRLQASSRADAIDAEEEYLAYANNPSTGFRPPRECRAPWRAGSAGSAGSEEQDDAAY